MAYRSHYCRARGNVYDLEKIILYHFLVLLQKLGAIANWGLNIEKNAIVNNALDYQTNVEGVYAIGDVNTYPRKIEIDSLRFPRSYINVSKRL